MKLSKTHLCALSCVLAFCAGQAHADLLLAQRPLVLGGLVEPNVLFVLDDSGSMHWETMPDEMTELAIGELDCTGEGNWGNNQTRCYAMWMYPLTLGVHGDGDYTARRVPRFEGHIAARLRSSHNNTVYYNPAVTYLPWINADGTEMPPASASAALHNPVKPGLGTRNLSSDDTQTARWINDDGSDICHTVCANPDWTNIQRNACMNTPASAFFCPGESLEFYPAVYYHYLGSGDLADESSYEYVPIRAGQSYSGHGRENRTDCNGGTCTGEQELQNFANWYTYHRNRVFAARAGIGRAFSEQSDSLRVGYGTINTPAHSVDGRATQTVIHGVRRFGGNTRERFFTELYTRDLLDQWNRPQGTPLREALQGAGEYFSRSDDQGPWSDTPGDTGDAEDHLECRQSYTVLMTDGYWNQSGTIPGTGNPGTPIIPFDPVGNVDGTYGSPFGDSFSDTLADVAMHYWENDLRTDLDDRVPTSRLNPANWQHMVTFGVGLGVEGELDIDPDDIFNAIRSGQDIQVDWPDPLPNDAGTAKIDDLLHAGVNSRGGFFSAMDAEQFSRQLSNVLRQIQALAGASTGISASSSRLEIGTFVFRASFDSDHWAGQVEAIDSVNGDVIASAGCSLNCPAQNDGDKFGSPGERRIYTSFNNNRRDFDANLPPALKERIASQPDDDADEIIAYVRGDRGNEQQNGGDFRDRATVLGHIVNSELVFSGKRNEGWARLPGAAGERYADYLNDPSLPNGKRNRNDTIFVGANDGMLHAFDAQVLNPDTNPTVSLREQFAYVPNAVLDNLHNLKEPTYGDGLFVDGQISVADAYWNNSWKTVLVGGLGAGGRAIYALDVTRPDNPGLLWEITHETPDFQDLGYTFGRPQITRLGDGTFVAVFGNGYHEDRHDQPSLYVVRLDTGERLARIDVPLGNNPPADNGLSGPTLVLDPATRTFAIRAYAGDLHGHVWRFDFNANNVANSTASRLFRDPGTPDFHANAITSAPAVAVHPSGGTMVFVGTGKMLERDGRDYPHVTPVRRFFALRDRGLASATSISFNSLAEVQMRVIDGTEPEQRQVFNDNTESIENGWYLDLAIGTQRNGERVIARPQVVFGRVVFTTFQPDADACAGGGISRLYILNATSGDGILDRVGGDQAGAVIIKHGVPSSVPIAILPPIAPPGTSPPGPGYAPGEHPDPDLPPFNPETAPRGERAEWCGSIGVWTDQFGFMPFGTLCEGRQVWREIR